MGQVFQQTFVRVDEVGTVAAAATAVVMKPRSLDMSERKEFRADHPFLFFVRDTKTGLVLFVGRILDPTAQ